MCPDRRLWWPVNCVKFGRLTPLLILLSMAGKGTTAGELLHRQEMSCLKNVATSHFIHVLKDV